MLHRAPSTLTATIAVLALGALSSTAAFGQTAATSKTTAPAMAAPAAGPNAAAGELARDPEQLRREILERMAELRAWKLVKMLSLDQTTSAKLFPLLAKYDERMGAVWREQHELVKQLRAETEQAHPDNGHLLTLTENVLANRMRLRRLEDERMRDLRKVLSPVQQAKLVLVLPHIEGEFMRRIREARQGDHGPRADDGDEGGGF